MKYQIVSGKTVAELESNMNFYFLEEGFKPHGSLLYEGGVYRQAVIKEEEND
tara:strand:+ start:51 stop:206 length:156 start_codon:yes stop_codon:yes gene_type:complete